LEKRHLSVYCKILYLTTCCTHMVEALLLSEE